MSRRLHGIGASPGRAHGPTVRVMSHLPPVPHRTISKEEVEPEVERFEAARTWAKGRIAQLHEETSERIGPVEGKIFEAQGLMLDDPDLVSGTISYIRENFLSAERAFDWRLLELRSRFAETAHVMALDRLADLRDIRERVLRRLLERPDSGLADLVAEDDAVLVFDELTPSLAIRLDPERVLGLMTATGSRASHAAVIARALGIPAVVALGSQLSELGVGESVILDGGTGRIILDPTEDEIESYVRAVQEVSALRARVGELAERPARTSDGERIILQANLDQPYDARRALEAGAEGIGLFRSEFLVIGRRVIPSEDEQYEAYRRVVEVFPEDEVTVRTFDIGGDKFPIFLPMPFEENPYLGWRAIRVCLDLPDLFRNQLRAAVRAARHGHVRILIPFVVSTDEIRRTRDILQEVSGSLDGDGTMSVPLGIMVETPAALETIDRLAPYVDFLSLGSNDLTQYTLAVDRGNARLADLYDPLHPALMRMYERLIAAAEGHDLEVSVCGDIAEDPVGLAALIGLGYRKFSVSPSALPEVKELIFSLSASELRGLLPKLRECERPDEIRGRFTRLLEQAVPEGVTLLDRLSAV